MMDLFVASDLHGSAYWCRRVLEAYDREGTGRLLLLGDILYHGPRNDLPRDYAPKEVFAMLNERAGEVFGVRGNCDAEIDQVVLRFPMMAEYCLLFAGPRAIFATHGHTYHKENLPPLKRGDILLQGHTHVPDWTETAGGVLCVNPGSAALPKDGSRHGYLILSDTEIVWKDLDGSVYHRLAL